MYEMGLVIQLTAEMAGFEAFDGIRICGEASTITPVADFIV